MSTLDTTSEAAAVQTEIHRLCGAAGRLRLAVEMSETVRAFAKAGIRSRHPELAEADVAAELMRRLYGVSLSPP